MTVRRRLWLGFDRLNILRAGFALLMPICLLSHHHRVHFALDDDQVYIHGIFEQLCHRQSYILGDVRLPRHCMQSARCQKTPSLYRSQAPPSCSLHEGFLEATVPRDETGRACRLIKSAIGR